MTTRLIRPYPRVNDPKDIEKWYNELRRAVLSVATNTDSLPEGTTNLYFTNERVDDRAAALIQAGNVITWVYNDSAGTLTPTIGVDTAAGLGVSGGKIVVVLASNKGITFDGSGDLQVKDGDGIKVGSAGVEVDYNSTNLKITANQLNTIQDISTTSTPTFAGLTLTGSSYVLTNKYTLAYNSSSPVNLFSFPNATQIYQVIVDVTTAFNATGPATVSTGVSGDTDRYTSTTDVNLAVVGTYVMDVCYYEATAAQMIATFSAGTGGSTGAATIYTLTSQPS